MSWKYWKDLEEIKRVSYANKAAISTLVRRVEELATKIEAGITPAEAAVITDRLNRHAATLESIAAKPKGD